jgi:ArsR family transcriptional regulator
MKTDLRAIAQCFHLLSDPTRLAILRLIAEAPLNVTTIAKTLGKNPMLVGGHLRLLRVGRLVKTKRTSSVVYSVDKATMKTLASELRSLMPK